MTEYFDDGIRKQFEDALASERLRELCEEMKAKGQSQVAIYEKFAEFLGSLQDANREADYDAVADALDGIVGWCSPATRWFDQYLTNEEIYAHQCGLTEKEVHEIAALISKEDPNETFCALRKGPSGELTVNTLFVRAGKFHQGRRLIVQKEKGGWRIAKEN